MLRLRLESLIKDASPSISAADLQALKALVASLKLNDSKSVEEVCEAMGLDIASWFKRRPAKRAIAPSAPVKSATSPGLEERFREAFYDDQKFATLINDLRTDRRTTKAVLESVYDTLFGTRGRVSRTKAQLLQDIADERLVRVRHQKSLKSLAVPAE